MIKFIKTFLGIEATAKNIRGRKSQGVQDYCAPNWKQRDGYEF